MRVLLRMADASAVGYVPMGQFPNYANLLLERTVHGLGRSALCGIAVRVEVALSTISWTRVSWPLSSIQY